MLVKERNWHGGNFRVILCRTQKDRKYFVYSMLTALYHDCICLILNSIFKNAKYLLVYLIAKLKEYCVMYCL